jgi:hypothetical protein
MDPAPFESRLWRVSLRSWIVFLLVLVATIWRCVNVRGE